MGRVGFGWLLLPLLLAGCLGTVAGSSLAPGQVDVFGVRLGSATDFRELNGDTGNDEPCLHGFDRSFDALDIVIGYDRDGRIRTLTTRNPSTAMFGIRPGDALATAPAKLQAAGFEVDGAPHRYRKDELSLNLLVDATGSIFGLTLAARPAEP